MSSGRGVEEGFYARWLMVACAVFALVVAAFPVARAFYRVEVDYNEGWNVYNAATVVAGRWLYPVKSGWTSVNYPMGWFALLAWLHRGTGEYLFTGRALSVVGLAGQAALVGAIVRRMGGGRQAAWVAAWFIVAAFAADADQYVGMNDPQMFAQVFFVAGLLVFVVWRQSWVGLAGAALLFVVGGTIKHNPIDFPLAVLVEVLLVSRVRAAWFAGCGLGFAAVSVWANVRFGGPHFVDQLLAPRSWSAERAIGDAMNVMGPLLLPLGVAVGMAVAVRKDGRRRIAAILLATTLGLGGYFGGGRGVSINALFPALVAVAILLGLFVDAVAKGEWEWTAGRKRWTAWAPAGLMGWLVIPWLLVPAIVSGFAGGAWEPVGRFRATVAAEQRSDDEVVALRELPGPALCESLLACYWAGKPYVYDPFNATRLIEAGRLDAGVMVRAIGRRQFGAVEFEAPIAAERSSDRWDPRIVAAIEANYVPARANEDGEIYVPRQ